MIVWRICRGVRAPTAFDGEGARLYPGRWNHAGVPMVYCASSLSLATLEYFVHLDPPDLPDDLVSIRAEVPDRFVEILDASSLPPNWRDTPAPDDLKDIGSAWPLHCGERRSRCRPRLPPSSGTSFSIRSTPTWGSS